MRLLLLITGMLFCGCNSTNLSTQVQANAEVVRVTLPNGRYTKYIKFTYEGHEYLTDYRSEFLYHLPSCPCQQSQLKSILDYE